MVSNIQSFLRVFFRHIYSRWLVFGVDLLLVAFSFFIAYLLRFNFELSEISLTLLMQQTLSYTLVMSISFLLFRPHCGIVRHTCLHESFIVFIAVSAPMLALVALSGILRLVSPNIYLHYSLSVLLIAYLVTLFLMLTLRFSIKMLYTCLTQDIQPATRALVFGAGELGLVAREKLESTGKEKIKVVAFIDDNAEKIGKRISGLPVYGDSVLSKCFLKRHKISKLVLAAQNLSVLRKNQIINLCLEHNLEVRTVPRVEDWIKGKLSQKQIRKVNIEELMVRDTIRLDSQMVSEKIKGKVVMVTGAAGSIGSELARQINHMHPLRLVLLDQAETPLFELEQSFRSRENGGSAPKDYVLADISEASCMRRIFERYRPQLIFHAAAYKHVPVIESNPMEAVRVNILGTRNMMNLASEYAVQKFVLISTDKAVNPSSMMGASKRVAEIMAQSMNHNRENKTRFIITRFGNVLGSNGSVIPIFEKQIASGGPVTITHPEIVRFFMTIPEACGLVLEASNMGKGGEIFVFDMGQQMRILDVANKMIRLSGLEPGEDIDIIYTGLRPGEKLHEELFSPLEENIPTHHPTIMIARFKDYPYREVPEKLDRLCDMFKQQDLQGVKETISHIVPEYLQETSLQELSNGYQHTTSWRTERQRL